ncbi:hypothetical protein [Allosalinactinospora lopnorensis]|uniref:hypothetical protein n=1 Tax=Allosalinactinospora lopnorensis TaxID=1352348 RepID=UPI000623BDE5|nr:hypothetical protein [Allosalinactinospora lopnorensis]
MGGRWTAAAPGGPEASRASLGLRVGSDAAVYCHTYADSKPILALASRGIYVSVTCRDHDGAVTPEDLAFAGELASQAKHFLAALEELHARTVADADTGTA